MTIEAKSVLRELESLGTAQNRKVYGRHGVRGKQFGVSYANLGKLKCKYAGQHALARKLWASGIHDARVLAAMIADPSELTARELEAMVKDLENYVLTDALAGLVARTDMAAKCVERWVRSRKEFLSSAGWGVLCHLALGPGRLTDASLKAYLRTIERTLHAAPNRTRYAMNNALIAIGSRNTALRSAALAAARALGEVEVDHGETGCKTPDAVAYIARVAAHRAGRRKKA